MESDIDSLKKKFREGHHLEAIAQCEAMCQDHPADREARSLCATAAWYDRLIESGVSRCVVRQIEALLSTGAHARVTLARMSDALAVQINGLGLALWAVHIR